MKGQALTGLPLHLLIEAERLLGEFGDRVRPEEELIRPEVLDGLDVQGFLQLLGVAFRQPFNASTGAFARSSMPLSRYSLSNFALIPDMVFSSCSDRSGTVPAALAPFNHTLQNPRVRRVIRAGHKPVLVPNRPITAVPRARP